MVVIAPFFVIHWTIIMGISGIYLLGDAFIPGEWQRVPGHMYEKVQRNSIEGIWVSQHNHYK